jgi:phosphatidylglycerol:prolipoprotein diacylglycerol transferase
MTETQYYVHNIDPVLIHIYGDFGIRYYGLAYLLAFVISAWLLHKYYRAGKSPLNPEQQSTALIVLVMGVLIGGRLGHILLYDFWDTLHDPLNIFRVWQGGMASHGGFVGVILAGWWLSKRYNINYLRLADLLASLAPPGLMLGRIANFINGELWGTPTTVPWAVIFPASAAPGTPIALIQPRHPSQLYEAALEGLFLMLYTQWRVWRTDTMKSPGRLSGEFLLLYAVVRIIGEQFRAPDSPSILGLNRGIFYSFFLAVAGILLLAWTYRTERKSA